MSPTAPDYIISQLYVFFNVLPTSLPFCPTGYALKRKYSQMVKSLCYGYKNNTFMQRKKPDTNRIKLFSFGGDTQI